MSSGIVLSAGIRQNLLSLQNTASLMATSQNRLATGKKVNSALDNPSNFFTAAGLNNRASDLGNLLDSMSSAIKTIEAANNGITALTKLVESAQSTARQALQAGSNANGTFTGNTNNITRASTITTGGVLTLQNGTGPSVSLTIANGADVGSVIDQINNANVGFKADIVTSGANTNLRIASTTGQNLTTSGTAISAGTLTAQTGLTATTYNASASAAAARAELAQQFDGIRTQIGQLIKDTGFNGKNLLNGDSLDVVFNEQTGANQSKLTVAGVTFDANGLGIAAPQNSFAAEGDINAALTNLTTALGTIRSEGSRLGSQLSTVQARQDFTKSMVNTLQTGADNLVIADTNEEAANVLALQTRQQLSTTALSLANQAAQGVLRLF
jgi:flagellin-like hook-associated protein FlgL